MTTLKTIVLDLDGTLLNDEKKISPKTKKALMDAQASGIKLILASGRPTPAMYHLAKELEMDKHHGFLISFNGACVTDCETGEEIYNQHVDPSIAKDLFNHLKKFDVIPMIADDKYMYVNNVYNHLLNPRSHVDNDGSMINIIEYEARPANHLIREMSDFASDVDFPLHKILIAADPVYLLDNFEAIREPFKQKLTCVFSAPFYYEFTDQGVDKANTLSKVLKPLGMSAQNVIAFGDGHNDKTLLEFAHIGVAMDNAEDEVKAIATHITHSNNEDGIATALSKYNLI